MALFGSLATVRAQLAHWENSHGLRLRRSLLARRLAGTALLDGLTVEQMQKVELGGGVLHCRRRVVTFPAGVPTCPQWKSHKAYIDVQAVIVGEEIMELSDVSNLTVSEDLRRGQGRALLCRVSEAFDVARECRRSRGVLSSRRAPSAGRPAAPTLVRKVVVKVPVAA